MPERTPREERAKERVARGTGPIAVSFHGGAGNDAWNNVYVFPPGPAGSALLEIPPTATGVKLVELRAFVLGADGRLYVANAWKNESQILRFVAGTGHGPAWRFDRVFTAEAVAHPFDLCFWPDGQVSVSNQDSRSVTTYHADGSPAPLVINHLTKVRGLACDGTRLFVADTARDEVRVYDRSGHHRRSIEVPTPVHVAYDGRRWLWIGSEGDNSVWVFDTAPSGSPTHHARKATRVVHGHTAAIDRTAGLHPAPGSSPDSLSLLVASRLGRRILAFAVDVTPHAPSGGPRRRRSSSTRTTSRTTPSSSQRQRRP